MNNNKKKKKITMNDERTGGDHGTRKTGNKAGEGKLRKMKENDRKQ